MAANRLTPGALVGILRYSGEARLTEALPIRPQDFVIACGVSLDTTLTAAELAAGSVSPQDSGHFNFPTYVGSSYLFFGVPLEAPDVTGVFILGSPNNLLTGYVAADPLDYNGTPYRWIRSSRAQADFLSTKAVLVTTNPQQ